MARVLLLGTLCVSSAFAELRPEKFTFEESVAAHETMRIGKRAGALIVSSHGRYVAWCDGKNLFAGREPDFAARPITSHADGAEIVAAYASSDGRSIFYTRGRVEPAFGPYPAVDTRELWQVEVEQGRPVRIASGADVPRGRVSFAPGGSAFAFAEGAMLYEFHQVASEWQRRPLLERNADHFAAIGIADIVYSPDGTRLAFVSKRKAGQSYVGVLDLRTRAYRYLEPGIFADAKPAWSPDSTQLVFMRAPGNWARAYRFTPARSAAPWSMLIAEAKSGTLRELWRAEPGRGSAVPDAVSAPVWTKQGQILFLWEKTGWQQLYSIPVSGGTLTLLTPGEGEVSDLGPVLDPAGNTVVYESNIDDLPGQHLWRLTLPAGKPRRLTEGDGFAESPLFTATGGLAYLLSNDGRLPNRRVVSFQDRLIRLTPGAAEEAKLARVWNEFVDVQVVPVRAADGIVSHHLLTVPRGKPPADGYPVIVSSKGGPQGRVARGRGYARHSEFGQYVASRGYIFVEINYRGSTGFGLDYRLPAGGGATGASEVHDLAALARYLKNRPDVDPKRIGIMGHSYGGHLVGVALSRLPQAFAAGVHLSGVADWVIEMKKDGETADWPSAPSEFMTLSERSAIEDLARASSPLVKAWRAPTLFVMGEIDQSGHMESIIDLGYRLLERGVPVEFHVVPAGTHSGWNIFPHRKIVDFFERSLAAHNEPASR